MRVTIVLLGLSVLACADKPEPTPAAIDEVATLEHQPPPREPDRYGAGVRFELGNAKAKACARTLCVAGPGVLADDPNRDLGELCRRAPGVVRRCEGERCVDVWLVEQWQQGLAALIDSLDQDGNGRVDDDDPRCRINLVGWSTGGAIVAEQLPAALRADGRVSEPRAVVDRLVAMAPWAPDHAQLEVAANVRTAWIYRHTTTPAKDCSSTFVGGPWLSPAPSCGPDTTCFDYDYSQVPALAYLGRRGARSGAEIGHCDVPALVAKIGLDNLSRGVEALSELIPPYSNGEHGGRSDHRGDEPPRLPPPKL